MTNRLRGRHLRNVRPIFSRAVRSNCQHPWVPPFSLHCGRSTALIESNKQTVSTWRLKIDLRTAAMGRRRKWPLRAHSSRSTAILRCLKADRPIMTGPGTNPPFVGLTLNDGFRMNLPLERLPPDVFKNIYHSLAQFFFYTNQYVTG